jgi:hypothetical protein
MNKRLVFILIILILALSSCAPASQTSQESAPGAAPASPSFAEPEMGRGEAMDSGGVPAFESPEEMPAAMPGSGVQADVERLVIRNANLTIVVDDPGQGMTSISRMAETMGGFVVSSNLYKTTASNGGEFPEATITIRVPAAKLGEAMDGIKGLVKDLKEDVRAENVSGQDVTKEYTDLQSRLKNLEDTESQLREIMGSAVKTEDVLMVYNQLSQIREQIEVIKGQIQYYKESSDLSSISILLQATASVQPLEIGGWQPVGVARDAVQALINGLQVLGSVAIWLVLFALPIALLIYLPLRLLWVLLRRNRKTNKPQTPSAPPAL